MLERLFGSGNPGAAEALRRLACLHVQVVHSATSPPRHLLDGFRAKWSDDEWTGFLRDIQERNAKQVADLKQSGLWAHMTPAERTFVTAPLLDLTEQERTDASWLMEGAACLLWALGYLDAIPPYDRQASIEILKSGPKRPVRELLSSAALRPEPEIARARDTAELWHWRARTRQLQEGGAPGVKLPPGLTFPLIIEDAAEAGVAGGAVTTVLEGDFPAFGAPYRDASAEQYHVLTSIAMERHRAFNWLCGKAPGNRWDRTPTAT
jgi:hypothetical protein